MASPNACIFIFSENLRSWFKSPAQLTEFEFSAVEWQVFFKVLRSLRNGGNREAGQWKQRAPTFNCFFAQEMGASQAVLRKALFVLDESPEGPRSAALPAKKAVQLKPVLPKDGLG